MGLIEFKNIKLFKRDNLRSAGPSLSASNGNNESKAAKPQAVFMVVLKSHWVFIVFTSAILALFLAYAPSKHLPSITKGEISSSDIVAPFDLTYEDKDATEKQKMEAENSVVPVYNYDPNVYANIEEKIRHFFSFGREWLQKNARLLNEAVPREQVIDKFGLDLEPQDIASLVRFRFTTELEEALINILSKIFGRGIILSKNFLTRGEREKGIVLINLSGGEQKITAEQLYDLGESEDAFRTEVEKIKFSDRERTLLRNLASIILTPNVTYNKIETEKRKYLARNSVEPVLRTIKKGRVIIRKGDEATEDSLAIIEFYNKRLQRKASWIPGLIGIFMLFGLLFTALWYYLKLVYKKDVAGNNLRMTGTLLISSFIIYKIFLALAGLLGNSISTYPFSLPEIYYYAFPVQIGTLIFASIFSDSMPVIFCILNSLAVGYFLGTDLNIMLFAFLGGLAAIYGVSRFKRRYRGAVLQAGFSFIPLVNILFLLTYYLKERGTSFKVFAGESLLAIFGGIASGALAFLLLPLVESIFGFITASKLLELSNADLPVFRQMSLEAPGTYHHSLVVAALAEKAAEELGLDAQMVRVSALYHDIGKLKMPEYFIENQSRDIDLHKDLKPSMSTLVIINHVKEGVDAARKLRLPKQIRQIIEQHHGRSLVRYFFQKAKQSSSSEHEKVGEETYRYPGPTPKTKEAALVMMSDAVEAASRSLRSPTKDSLRRVITDILNAQLQDGQLDDCGISLQELRTVAVSFLTTLFSIYHPRVSYPGFTFEVRQPQEAAKETKTKKEIN